MEKSIKRVEKLVHATNSALAQMKFSLIFDDINGRRAEDFDSAPLKKFLDTDDLNLRRNEFKSEASETVAKLDNILMQNELTGKNLKPLDRIKEINKKMRHLKLEQTKRGETRQSRQKLLSLISEEKFSPEKTSSKGSVVSKQTLALSEEREPIDKNHLLSESVLVATRSSVKPKAELKNKILETQEIVDRGFQTARHLTQKVDSLTKSDKKDKSPSSGKTLSEINLRSLEGKTESHETVKTVKCRRCSGKKKKKRGIFLEGEFVNTKVIGVRRNELKRDGKINLQLQHLPSLHIRGGLKVQKIHNLEIASNKDLSSEKANTAISFFSHEQMEREKMEKVRENCGCFKNESLTNYVECFNCGKLLRVCKTWVDPQSIDEVLRECDFNVFDPRIDDFVEKCRGVDAKNPSVWIEPDAFVAAKLRPSPKNINELPDTYNQKEVKIRKKRFTFRDLSDQLCKKYKEEADALADCHLRLDEVLRNLFKKVEESKEVFETCHLLKTCKTDPERAPVLTTETLPGAKSLLVRSKQKKLNKKDIKNRRKSRTDFLDENEFFMPSLPSFKTPVNPGVTPERGETPKRFSLSAASGRNENSQISREESKEFLLVTSLSSHSIASSSKPGRGLKGQDFKKNTKMASFRRKNTKLLKEKFLRKSLGIKSKVVSLETRKKEIKEEVLHSVKSSDCIQSKAAKQTDFCVKSTGEPNYLLNFSPQLDSSLPVHKDENFGSSNKNSNPDIVKYEEVGPRQTPSEKTENSYESDFESFTNEPEEQGNDYEGGESKLNPVPEKLSGVTEVHSEFEKKLCSNQKAQLEYKELKFFSKNEINSTVLGVTPQNKQTEGTSPKTVETSQKGTSMELVTSLKDILTALQNQFAETESLAEKLTENAIVEIKNKSELATAPIGDSTLNPWEKITPFQLVENLQSSRKDWTPGPKVNLSLAPREKAVSKRNQMPPASSSEDCESDEGGSSLGEIIVSEGRRNNSGTASSSGENFLHLTREDKSFFSPVQRNTISFSGFKLVT